MLKHDPIARHIFTDLLLLANGQTGEALVGRNYLARISGFHPSTVYKVLNRLAKAGMVEQQSNSKGTTILICNFARWQQQSNSKVTLLKKKEERIDKYIYSPESREAWAKLWRHIKTNYPYTKDKEPEAHKANCVEIDKIHRIDGYEWPLIEQVIDWCQADTFWRLNIKSGAKLREKFETILDRMVEERKKQRSKHA